MKHRILKLSCLSELQAAKWFLLHERQRHLDDVNQIDDDLEKLKDITLPLDVMNVLSFRFEIPEQTKNDYTIMEQLNEMVRGK
jgi:hypothetical protein